MKKRPKLSDGEKAELVVPKKRKSARLLAFKDNDKQTVRGESTDAATNASKDTCKTPEDADSSASDSSPNNNCPICLGQLENKSFTDSCFHTFCFVCLLEWSKVKAVCPLCKQQFKSIIHSVRSIEDYDQYYLRTDELTSDDSRRFRYRTTVIPGARHRRETHELHHRMLLQRPSRAMMRGPWGRSGQAATSEFRQRIYATGAKVKELVPTGGRPPRYRDISAAFFARNPASTHRLVPWLNRELNVLLNHHDDHIQFVLELILELITRYSIDSEEFFQHIQPFTDRRTRHFIHEFYSFARAPYDIVAYDQNAVYDNVDLPVHEIESEDESRNGVTNDDDDDSDVIMLSPPPRGAATDGSLALSLTPLLDRVRNFLGTFSQQADTAHTGWDTPVPGTSHSWSPQYTATCPEDPIDITDSTTHQNVGETSCSSAASDVEIVAVEKPWDCRTPICLSSDSDSGLTVPTQYRGYGHHSDARRRSRSLSSTRSHRTDHSSRRRRSRSSSHRRLKNWDNHGHRRHRELSRRTSRSPHDRRDRRRNRDSDLHHSTSSHRRHRDRDGRRDLHRSDRYRGESGYGRSHYSSASGRHGERQSTERHSKSRSRSHICMDSDSSHSSHRHKRRHKDRHDRGDRRERRRRDDDTDPPCKRTMGGDVSNDASRERRYKKHPTGHKHSKSTDKVSTMVKVEKNTAVLKSVVVQPFCDGDIRDVPIRQEVVTPEPLRDVPIREEAVSPQPLANDSTKHQELAASDASYTVRNEETCTVGINQVPDPQLSTRELGSHKECPSTDETAPSVGPLDGNDTAKVAGCENEQKVEPADCGHESQTTPPADTGREVLQAVDIVANIDDRADVESDESSSVDVESIEPNMSVFGQQPDTLFSPAAKCLSISDDDIQVVDAGSITSSNNDNGVSHCFDTCYSPVQNVFPQQYEQINVTSSGSSSRGSSLSTLSDSSSGTGVGLSIDITTPDKENCSGGYPEQCISITDDDDDNSQSSRHCSLAEISGNMVEGGNVCQQVVSVSDDDNSISRNIQSDTTDSMSGDFSLANDKEGNKVEEKHQLQNLKDALAANNNINTDGTDSAGLVEQLKQLLPVQENSQSEQLQKQCRSTPSVTEGDDSVDLAKEIDSDRGDVQTSDGPNQKNSAAEHVTAGTIQEGSQSGKSQKQCLSATEVDNNMDVTRESPSEVDSPPSVMLGGCKPSCTPMEHNESPLPHKGHRTYIHGDNEMGSHFNKPSSTVRLDDSVQQKDSSVAPEIVDTNSHFVQLKDSVITSEIVETNSVQQKDSNTNITSEVLQQDVVTDDDDDDDDAFAELYLEDTLNMNL